jgi:hypothetical protein
MRLKTALENQSILGQFYRQVMKIRYYLFRGCLKSIFGNIKTSET